MLHMRRVVFLLRSELTPCRVQHTGPGKASTLPSTEQSAGSACLRCGRLSLTPLCWLQVLDERLSYAVEHCTTYDNLPNAGRFSRTHSKDDEVVRCPTHCSLDAAQVRGAHVCEGSNAGQRECAVEPCYRGAGCSRRTTSLLGGLAGEKVSCLLVLPWCCPWQCVLPRRAGFRAVSWTQGTMQPGRDTCTCSERPYDDCWCWQCMQSQACGRGCAVQHRGEQRWCMHVVRASVTHSGADSCKKAGCLPV